MRLIDADALLKIFNPMEWDCTKIDASTVVGEIRAAPTIEVAPVAHGRWDGPFRVDANHNGYKCSVCGYFGVPGWVACPKCAARMDGDGNA